MIRRSSPKSGPAKVVSWTGILLLTMLLLPACAGKNDRSIPADISNLYLAPFENSSSETGLENLMTDEVTQQFLSDGRLSLVPRDRADAILVGEIRRYKRIPLIYNEQDVVQQYKLRIEIGLRLLEPGTGTVLRSWPMIFQETTYSDVIAPIETELDAQERVIRQLARDVVTFTVEGWPYLKTKLRPRRTPPVPRLLPPVSYRRQPGTEALSRRFPTGREAG